MTKEEAEIIQGQINIMENYIITIFGSHVRALRELIDELIQKE